MALTQMQLIQSLGEAMAWFERELSWGVPATELRHLCGRIGELYAALITNGQMATAVNQRGYDVVSKEGERISVKTTATETGGGQVMFSSSSLDLVDRVIVLRINTEKMQIETVLDALVEEARSLMTAENDGKRSMYLGRIHRAPKPRADVKAIREVTFAGAVIRELETGTIEVERNGAVVSPAKPALRDIAAQLNISLVNSAGNTINTQQLGTQIIKTVKALDDPISEASSDTEVGDNGAPSKDTACWEEEDLATRTTAVRTVTFRNYTIRELETGTIEVERDGITVLPAKPALREIATLLNIALVHASGNPLTTRQLGTQIIRSIQALNEETVPPMKGQAGETTDAF